MAKCAACGKPITPEEAYREVELAGQVFLICCPMCHSALEAGELQRSMMPRSYSAPGLTVAVEYRPALQVGGDYALLHPRDGGPLCLVVADVAGHGVKPSLMASRLSAEAENLAEAGRDPSGIASHLNSKTSASFLAEALYLTLLAADLDLAALDIHFVNCGHPPPLLWSRRQGTYTRLHSQHLPVGMFGPEVFGEPSVFVEPFEAGDRLFVYTDGITELELAADQELGEEGLVEILDQLVDEPAPEVGRRVFERLDSHGAGPDGDDLLLVCCDFT